MITVVDMGGSSFALVSSAGDIRQEITESWQRFHKIANRFWGSARGVIGGNEAMLSSRELDQASLRDRGNEPPPLVMARSVATWPSI